MFIPSTTLRYRALIALVWVLWSACAVLLLLAFRATSDAHTLAFGSAAIVLACAAHSAASDRRQQRAQGFYVRLTDTYHGRGEGLTSEGMLRLADDLIDPTRLVGGDGRSGDRPDGRPAGGDHRAH